MKALLAVDTSGRNGSLALARVEPGQPGVTVLEVAPLSGGAFSAELVPQVAALLARHNCKKEDVVAFAVATGPGSFTGLRVGLAAIKAMAEVLRKPIVAVSRLEAIAAGAQKPGRILAALDAGRTDVYLGDYELDSHLTLHSERFLSREAFLAAANRARSKGATIATPDSLLADALLSAGIDAERIPYPDSGLVADLGWQHLMSGRSITPGELDANYLRHSDAEIFAQPPR